MASFLPVTATVSLLAVRLSLALFGEKVTPSLDPVIVNKSFEPVMIVVSLLPEMATASLLPETVTESLLPVRVTVMLLPVTLIVVFELLSVPFDVMVSIRPGYSAKAWSVIGGTAFAPLSDSSVQLAPRSVLPTRLLAAETLTPDNRANASRSSRPEGPKPV